MGSVGVECKSEEFVHGGGGVLAHILEDVSIPSLDLFSLITASTRDLVAQAVSSFRRAASYHKSYPTFAYALELVRKELWAQATFCGSPADTDAAKVPQAFMEHLTDALCYPA